jgi:hypothetical protein
MINNRNASAQPAGPPAETTLLESREGNPRRLRRVVQRGGPLRSTTAELIRVQRHKFPDAHRRPALLSGGLASIGPADGEAAMQEFSIGAGSGKA